MESLFEFVGLDGWTGPDRDGQVAEDSMGPVQRMGQEEEAPTTVKAWVDHTSASYWWIDADANSITYVTGQKFQLPDELLKLGIENCEIGDGLDVFNATVGCGCLKMKCAEVSDVKSLDLPYWKKEVPVATASPPGTRWIKCGEVKTLTLGELSESHAGYRDEQCGETTLLKLCKDWAGSRFVPWVLQT